MIFDNFSKQKSMIIELSSCLEQIYTKDYQFTLRELGAWRTMLKRVGCHNVTPYTNGEFPVIIL